MHQPWLLGAGGDQQLPTTANIKLCADNLVPPGREYSGKEQFNIAEKSAVPSAGLATAGGYWKTVDVSSRDCHHHS